MDLAIRFPQIVSSDERDNLEEFLDFLMAPADELPKTDDGVDTFWGLMSDIQDTFTGKQRFPILSKLAKACCVVPVSNADPERIFSMLKKIQTDMRSELHNDTVCSLVCAKQNQDVQCYDYNPSDTVLKAAKQSVLSYQSSINNKNCMIVDEFCLTSFK